MTSRVSFYKVMIQDLRHKIWMIALSCLGSFLAMPVFYLLQVEEWENRIARWTVDVTWDLEAYKIEAMTEFFRIYLPITCGVILGVGALIVGIFGFRHVFSKKMVDQYHSIPIKRRDLFFANYINGFLIWFVPMIIGGVVCIIMAGLFLGDFTNWMIYAVGGFGLTVLNLVIAFLLIYHVAIVAVMLSGNILNTLVNGAIISFGALALYGMVEVFCATYFETYYSFFTENIKNVIWASPIASAIFQLYMYAADSIFVFPLVMNILMIVIMFVIGFVLYIRRPSELAEQGMKIKTAQVLFKTIFTILVGMVGWWFFHMLTGTLAWQIFGTVLAGGLCYGILDIIFHMDFKAFFAHKVQFVITVVAAILVGCTFCFDWIGYDRYLPEKEDIAEMGIYVQNFGINNTREAYDGILTIKNRINRMHYKNEEVIYNLLETLSGKETQYGPGGYSATAYVRVKEDNGKTYYRQYRIWESDEDLIVPVLRDESYVRANVMIPQVIIDDVTIEKDSDTASLESFKDYWHLEDEALVKELLTAYNEDILENPDLFIYQNDNVFANMYYNGGSEYIYLRPDFYESMERVKAVLRQYGYEEVLKKITADELENITMEVHIDKNENQTLKSAFGLEDPTDENVNSANGNAEIVIEDYYYGETKPIPVGYAYYAAKVTEQQDMEELLDVISFNTPNYRTVFREDFSDADVVLTLKNKETYYVHIKEGKLPEKFIEYFEETLYE